MIAVTLPNSATKLLTAEEFAALPEPADGSRADATLAGGDILPNFTCPVASFFESV